MYSATCKAFLSDFLAPVTFALNQPVKEIESGVLTWQENKIFGGGIKSFHYNCRSINPEKWTLYGGVNCNQHPHNYYLEAVASLGILGLLIFYIGVIAPNEASLWGFIGLVPVITGILGWCPLYLPLKINTNK